MGTPEYLGQVSDLTKAGMASLLEQRQPGYSLPQPFYNDPHVFGFDLDCIFAKEWLFAGLTCEIPAPGNYFTLDIGNNPILVVRGQDRQVRAFHNVCRHRGSKICLQQRGKSAKLVCPYHQWTYEFNGELIYAGNDMGADFNRADFALAPVHCRAAGGYIFISLAPAPPDIDAFLRDLAHYLEPYDLDNATVAAENTLLERANWKLVLENNRECYHCGGSHPELLNTLLEWDDTTDPRVTEAFKRQLARKTAQWDAAGIPHRHVSHGKRNRLVRMPLAEGAVSMTLDGRPACRRPMGRIRNPDLGSLRILHLPNSWNHAMGDHLIAFQILPLEAQLTQVTTKWVVHGKAVEGEDYDVENLRRVWDATNDQDRALAENNQRGVNSMAYRPGPYSPTYEFGVVNFIDWYSETLQSNLS